MAKKHVTTAFAVYLLTFAVTLRLFLSGYHVTALLILVGVWVVIAVWIWLAGGSR